MGLQEIRACLRPLLKGEIRLKEPLRLHTTWRIGGPADLLVLPADLEDLQVALQFAYRNNLPCTVIGNGSNLLVADEGVRGIVIKLTRLNRIKVQASLITAEAGAMLPRIAEVAAQEGLAGLEFAAGIPATAGGAAVMNAGAHGGAMAEVVREVKAFNREGQLVALSPAELGYGYRFSQIKGRGYTVAEVTLAGQPGDPGAIRAKMQENLRRRREKQPLSWPNAGSIFKNPPGESAGRLIELAGGKGLRVGDAQVSAQHANFIVNLGNARAREVLTLIRQIQSLVQEKFGLELELEIQTLGL